MTTYGLVDTGFVEKPASVIADEIAAAQRASSSLGPDWDTSAESPEGQLNAVMVEALAELWEQLGVIYRARDPNGATFAALDAATALTGTNRRPATKGTVPLRLSVAAGKTVPSGSVVSMLGDTTNRWVTTTAAVNGTGGTLPIDVIGEAQTAGVFAANAGTLTVIATPVAGWLSVTNTADAEPGKAAETDPELRARRELELAQGGTSPADAVRAALLAVPGVTQAVVIENDSDATVDGVPPHSLESIVLGGTNAAVALALWKAKAGGISTHGSTTVSVLDAQGDPRSVKFTRPTDKAVWVQARIRVTSAYIGETAFKNALLTLNSVLLAGATVQISDLIVLARALRGVANVSIRLGTSSGYFADSDVPVGQRQRGQLAFARITVIAS